MGEAPQSKKKRLVLRAKQPSFLPHGHNNGNIGQACDKYIYIYIHINIYIYKYI